MNLPIPDFPLPAELSEAPLPQASALRPVFRIQHGTAQPTEDEVIEEVPVALVYNGISHAVMLASPTDLADFALGFSLAEGILEHPRQLYDLEVSPGCDGIAIEMEIAPGPFMALKERRRSLAGRTGCGLCGVESLAGVTLLPAGPRLAPDWHLPLAAIDKALRQLPDHQTLRQQTGSAHGAAWVDLNGDIRCLREDVGRHNALDKLIGALAAQATPCAPGFALITSRASYEMVQKAAAAGIAALIAVSAPTALAIRQAEAAGILLAGFARTNQLVVYSHPERLDYAGPDDAGHPARLQSMPPERSQ
jgi:FdhD protein